MYKLYTIFLSVIFLSCSEQKAQSEITAAFPNLSFNQPVDIQTPRDGSDRLFVVSQPGEIMVFDNFSSVTESKVFLDIRSKVQSGGEQGLLGIAFHPDYSSNGYFYIDYTAGSPRRTVISRFQVSVNDPDKADTESELVLLEVDQPYSNHNGGQLVFGPDGYLYISFGDGGSGGDPQNNGQNLSTMLGSIIRIDVNRTENGKNYAIPDDNPFNYPGAPIDYKKEIYAFGLRNVWRFSFDAAGRLWAADVGQNAWEEVNIIEKVGNYGWRIMEGEHCYNPPSGCDTEGLIFPIHEYGHNSAGGPSITGGYVYNGSALPEYTGKYIYGDFGSGNIWALEYNGSFAENDLIASTNYSISTFGLDESGEIYFADYSGGRIYKFNPNPTSTSFVQQFDFKLEQNYPNPYNPSTTIDYTVPAVESSHAASLNTVIKVYNMLGSEITTLVDKYQAPGKYSVTFDAKNLPSGIYYYRLSSGLYTEIKKMILLK